MNIYLGVPTYDGQIHYGVHRSIVNASAQPGNITSAFVQSSALTRGFNMLWCAALDGGFDYFVMLHADIEVRTKGWLDIMLKQLGTADVISAVSPLKDVSGLTSTGVERVEPDSQPHTIELRQPRRLTLRELADFPPTFTADDAAEVLDLPIEYQHRLVVNTGCLVVRLDRDWTKQLVWTDGDAIIQTDGGRHVVFIPEDWQFSRTAQMLGAEVLATKAVEIVHHGTGTWSSWAKHGQARDEEYFARGGE